MTYCFIADQGYLDIGRKTSAFTLHAGINEGSSIFAFGVLAELRTLPSSSMKKPPALQVF